MENYNCQARTESKNKKYKEKENPSKPQSKILQFPKKIIAVKEKVISGWSDRCYSRHQSSKNLGKEEGGKFRYRLISQKGKIINRTFNKSQVIGAILTNGKAKYRVCKLHDFEAKY